MCLRVSGPGCSPRASRRQMFPLHGAIGDAQLAEQAVAAAAVEKLEIGTETQPPHLPKDGPLPGTVHANAPDARSMSETGPPPRLPTASHFAAGENASSTESSLRPAA